MNAALSTRQEPVAQQRSALDRFVRPHSIAIVGASPHFAKVNGRPLKHLLDKGYRGRIYPVNPKYTEIAGLACFPDVESLPEAADLAVVALPARDVAACVAALGRRGVPAAVVFSSGFGEMGTEGKQLEAALKRVADEAGVALCGPNCLGFINAFDNVYATFSQYADGDTGAGPVAFVSQSGAFGTAIAALVRRRGLSQAPFLRLIAAREREIERWISSREPAASWSVALPATPDFRSHRTFVTPPFAKSGLYLVVASAERGFAKGKNRRAALPFVLSNLVLLQESQAFPWEARLVEGKDGRPAVGVDVVLYRNTWREAPRELVRHRSDDRGRVQFAAPEGSGYSNYLLLATRGGDIAFAQRYGGEFQPPSSAGRSALLFTDRAIYRPGQKLLWKALGY